MIEILETPPLNAIQDLGRLGYRCHGVGRGGAMDRVALAAANALLGNDENAAGIELQLFPVRVRFAGDTVFALTGADCEARLDGRLLPPWWAMSAQAGQELVLSPPRQGLRAYLAVAGGIDVPEVMGSRSTQMRDGFGGLDGRALAAGDRLAAFPAPAFALRDGAGLGALPASLALAAADCPQAQPGETVLRVIQAAEYEQFDAASQAALWQTPWKVTAQSNRQGYRLAGVALQRLEPVEMRSHGIVPGVIQVPPSGQPIIQLADGNSAGGYPKIGVVIEADLWRIAQAAPGSALRFVSCTLEEARTAERAVAAYLGTLRRLAGYCRLPSLGKVA
ncbi:MAG: biotin-dependent carboxyltransferase family protein [Proteobacteria bacterium]|nr:biotin-dependent carboxyltransferase family protein [Pseudomonadota bacterium]